MAFINSCRCPWVCIGDFNFTTNDKEILGGNRSGESSAINYLKEIVWHCQARINLLMDKITEVQRNPPSEHNGKVEEEL